LTILISRGDKRLAICRVELLDHLLNGQHLREGRSKDSARRALQFVPAQTSISGVAVAH
jgi:hypothetical protein